VLTREASRPYEGSKSCLRERQVVNTIVHHTTVGANRIIIKNMKETYNQEIPRQPLNIINLNRCYISGFGFA
jgi:hypothetical protein